MQAVRPSFRFAQRPDAPPASAPTFALGVAVAVRTDHKYRTRRRLALSNMRVLLGRQREGWAKVEACASKMPDPEVLVLSTTIGLLMDQLDDRLDDLLVETAA